MQVTLTSFRLKINREKWRLGILSKSPASADIEIQKSICEERIEHYSEYLLKDTKKKYAIHFVDEFSQIETRFFDEEVQMIGFLKSSTMGLLSTKNLAEIIIKEYKAIGRADYQSKDGKSAILVRYDDVVTIGGE